MKAAGYDPWLDEEELVAGTRLHRGLQEGLHESGAVVFFITEAFTDDRFLRQEVDWAMAEKTNREEFAVITIVLGDASSAQVPDVLRSFVWKHLESHLDALREILRALPTGSRVAG